MKYERFEDLPVWNAAMNFGGASLCAYRDRFFVQPGDLCDQLRRAALSVSNNIAKGFERGSTAELLAFLYIARGSAGEVRSMYCFTDRAAEAVHLKSEISDLISLAEICSRQCARGPTTSRTRTSRGSDTSTIKLAADTRANCVPTDFSGKLPKACTRPIRTSIPTRTPRNRISNLKFKSQISNHSNLKSEIKRQQQKCGIFHFPGTRR